MSTKKEHHSNLQQLHIDKNRIPKHVAIIMDGNGRWAQKRRLPRLVGHRAGVENLREIIEVSAEIGIKILTLYAFSTENWKRPKVEIDALMNLLVEYLNKEIKVLHQKNIKIIAIGDIYSLPPKPQKAVLQAIDLTRDNTGLLVNIALNYSGRNELVYAFKRLFSDVQKGILQIENVNEKTIGNYLYTAELSDPDLLIRTSGELRISNFLLWQLAYTEFWFTDILWPDFKKEHLLKAIYSYQKRERRYGAVSNNIKEE
ncbi:isoprenyl transferase [Garciella nitratireducens]|uniref:Isoprenyl transferase n=1 Tax=Garciella nitratireducens DSM 15102 TaxID=1121911 RepID=A0A1T4JX25_9FIRM|nr:isoprenyl transferase [Garciella nitratireducens]RBP41157.1 undecaprenyl diphosphate synthase [Garciella nitratireducens]SJZ34699.1 undecaprenyl diphosphate synthase [Garciella nitratireducens DSM 15102]